MYELFVMALKDYWQEQGDSQEDVDKNVEDLQNVLSEHYDCSVRWDEPEPDPAKADEEISVCAFTDEQFVCLQAVAAALELDGNLDDLDLDPAEPWDSPIFERLEAHLDGDDDELKHYPHLLNMGQSAECFIVPCDLPFVAQISSEDDDCGCNDDCECHCGEDDECSIDIASLPALRLELDNVNKVLKLDASATLDSIDSLEFDDDDVLCEAKVCWYILNARVNDALKAHLPLILHFNDEEGDDYDDDSDIDD